MSDNVDTRVVELDFQNKNFEKSAQESIRTLGNLERALKLDGSTEGLERVEKTARDMDLSVLERSVEKVSDKFSALGIMGVTAIQNITNKAIDAGEKLIRSLSFDQIMSGYAKMDQLTTATQTLRANGYEMEQIEKELEKLMFFSDETSYSFNDMTSNLAKFTSQGLELEQSATALRGVAAWAAAAGQNSQTASRAMYNISQALGAGSMKVTDWKSIELANMATSQFKELTLEAAAAVGTLTKKNGKYYLQEEKEVKVTKRDKKGKIVRDAAGQAVKEVKKETKETEVTIANFRETLKDGWFDNDTMMTVFKRYGAYSDLVQQIKDIFDLDSANQSMTLIDELSQVKPVKGQNISDLRAQILLSRGYVETLAEAKKLLQGLDFSAAYDEVSKKAYQAAQEAKTFNEAIDATKDAVSSGWMRTFQYIFGNYEQQKTLWTDVANRLWDIFAEGGDKRNTLLKKWAKTGTATVAGMITNLLDIVYNFKTLVSEAFTAVFGEITAEDLISFTDRVAGAIQSLKEFSEDAERTAKISSVLQGFARALKIVADVGGAVIKFAGNFISAFGGTFLEIALDIADFLFAPNALAEGAKNGLVGALEFTSKAIVSFADKVRTVWRNIRDFLRYLLDPSAAFSDAEKAGKQQDAEGYQRIKSLYGTVEKIRSVWDAVVKPLRAVADKIQYVWSLVRYVIDPKAGEDEQQAASKSGAESGLLDRIMAARKTALDIRTTLQTLWTNLSSAFNTAKDFVVGVLSTFGWDVSNAWANVTSWLGRFFAGGEETEKAVSELSDKIKGTWESIKQKIIDFAAGFGIDIPSIAEAVSGFFKSLFGANDKPKSVSELVREKGGILIASAEASDGGGMLKKANSAFDKGKKFGEKVKAAFEKISTFITNTWTAVSGFVSKAWNTVRPYIENAIVVVRFLFNPSLPDLSKVNDDAMVKRITRLHAIATRIRDVFTKLVSAVTGIIQSIKTFIKEQDILGKAGRLKDTFVKLFYDVTDFIKGFFKAFDIDLSEVWNKLLSGDFSGAIQKILDGLNNVSKWVSGKISGLFVATEGTDPKKTPLALAIAWVQNAANTIFNAIKNAKLSNIFTGIVSYLKNTIVPLFLLISGSMFVYGIGKAMANGKKGPGIGEIMQQIAGAMLVLSASFAILGAVDEKTIETGKDLLLKFIGIVAVIKVLFFAINWLNKKFGKDKDRVDTVAGVGNEMLQIAGALAIIALSIAGLSLLFKKNLLDLPAIIKGAGFIIGAGVLILGLVLALTVIQKKIKSKNESDSFEGIGDTVLKLAGAIGIFAVLAVAIGALTKFNSGLIWSGIGMVTAMAGILAILLAAIAVVQRWLAKGEDISKFGNLMLKLAGAIVIMAVVAVALGTMSDVAWNGILHIFVMLAIAVSALLGASLILSKNKLDKSAWINLAALVVVVGSVVTAFLLIPKDISWEQIVAVFGGIIVACGALAAVAVMIKKLGMDWKTLALNGLPTLLALAGMMAIVVVTLNNLPKGIDLKDIESFAAGMLVAIGALFTLSVIIALLGGIGPVAILAGAVSLAIIVAAVIGIVVLLGELEGEDKEISKRIENCKEIVEKLSGLFELVFKPLEAFFEKIGVILDGLVSFITELGTSLSTFIHSVTGFGVDEKDWAAFTSKDLRIARQAVDISKKLAGIYQSLILIGNGVDFDKSKKLVAGYLASIKILGGTLSAYIHSVTGFGVSEEDWKAFTNTDLAIATQATKIGKKLADIIGEVSKIAIYEDVDQSEQIAGATSTITHFSEDVVKLGQAFGTYINAVTSFGMTDDEFNMYAENKVDVAGRVTAIGGILADIIKAVSGITIYEDANQSEQITGATSTITHFSEDVVKLGQAFGTYINAVTSFGMTNDEFNTYAENKVDVAGRVTVIGGILADIIKAASGITIYKDANQSEQITGATGTITQFSEDVVKLGQAFGTYINDVTSFGMTNDEFDKYAEKKVDIADRVNKIGGKLAEIVDAASKITIYEDANQSEQITGATSTITQFSEDVVKLGQAFNTYINDVTSFGMTNDEFDKYAEKKVDVAGRISTIGGKLAEIIDAASKIAIYEDANQSEQVTGATSTITQFSEDIGKLGQAFGTYVTAVTSFGMTNDEFDKYAEKKVDVADRVNKIGGKLAEIIGAVSNIQMYNEVDQMAQITSASGTIERFTNDVTLLGTNLGKYIRSVTGFGVDGTTWTAFTDNDLAIAWQATEISNTLSTINTKLSELDATGGPMELLRGHKLTLDEFGVQLAGFGDSLSDYVGSLATAANIDGEDVDLDKIEKMTNIAVSFADFIGKLPKEGGWAQTIFGGSQWKELATSNKGELESFGSVLGEAVSAFSLHLSDFADPENVEKAKVASEIVRTFASAMTIFGTASDPLWKLDEFTSHLALVSFDNFDNETAEFAAQFVGGIGSILQTLDTATKDKDYAKRMSEVGKDILLGLLEGLSDETIIDKLIGQMQYIADNLVLTVRVATETHSPSRLFEKIGGYLIDGLSLGIHEKAGEPAKEIGKVIKGITSKIPKLNTGSLGGLVDSISEVLGSSDGLSADKLLAMLKNVLPERMTSLISDDAWKNLVNAVSGSNSSLDKNFISGWLKGILDELTSMDKAQKVAVKSQEASQKASAANSTGEFKHTGPNKWSTTPTKEWQLRYATYAEQKKHNYERPGIYADPPQVVRTYRADGTLAGTTVEDRRGYTYRQRPDGTVYAVDKMGNSLTPVQDAADKAKAAFERLNNTLNGTASASAEAAGRAAAQAKTGNQNETDKGVSDAVVKLNKDVTGGIDSMKRELVDEVGDLSESIRGLKVVLDDGTLVGKILPAIDRGLNIRTSKKERMYYIATP